MLVGALWLCGCNTPWPEPVGIPAAAGAASIVLIHRTPVDGLFSAISGRDCSIVYLDRLQDYCRPLDELPPPLPYCTRGLGNVDCWIGGNASLGRSIAEQPALTAQQRGRVGTGWNFLGI